MLELVFRDNGIGFEPEYAEQVFEIFKRLHTQKKYPGTGIGLALVQKITECHGGSVKAKSAVGQGSSFIVTLRTTHDPGVSDVD